MTRLIETIKSVLREITLFTQYASGITLRSYQIAPARRILDSIFNRLGDSIVIIFPRQSGKNELQAQTETYLLMLLSPTPAEIVKISPTWKPQTQNAMRRLQRTLEKNLLTATLWHKEQGYIYRIDQARIYFFSGHPGANIVGATATTMLSVDEAQDIQPAKFDKDIAPMGASTNATRVFWGTAWTSKTLLARERRAAEAAQKKDGRQRVFILSADDVRKEVPAYGIFVDEQIAKLGRNHPLVKTQYFSEEIDSGGSLFDPARRAMLIGTHSPQVKSLPGQTIAVTIDIAGADETAPSELDGQEAASRDNTTITAFSVTTTDKVNYYQTLYRRQWQNVKHALLLPQLKAEIDHWQARYIIPDATGMGEGITSFLVAAYGERVMPFVFTGKSKSDLGWAILAAIDTGRLKDYGEPDPAQAEMLKQLEYCTYEVNENKAIRWGVPDGTRDLETGELLNDDYIIGLAMITAMDDLSFGQALSEIIPAYDPLSDMSF